MEIVNLLSALNYCTQAKNKIPEDVRFFLRKPWQNIELSCSGGDYVIKSLMVTSHIATRFFQNMWTSFKKQETHQNNKA